MINHAMTALTSCGSMLSGILKKVDLASYFSEGGYYDYHFTFVIQIFLGATSHLAGKLL